MDFQLPKGQSDACIFEKTLGRVEAELDGRDVQTYSTGAEILGAQYSASYRYDAFYSITTLQTQQSSHWHHLGRLHGLARLVNAAHAAHQIAHVGMYLH